MHKKVLFSILEDTGALIPTENRSLKSYTVFIDTQRPSIQSQLPVKKPSVAHGA
jgi:hypothetical protein